MRVLDCSIGRARTRPTQADAPGTVLASALQFSVLLLARLAGLGYCSLVLPFVFRGGVMIDSSVFP